MVSAPRLLADAVAMGVVTAADAHTGQASVCPMPRSNAVHRVDRRGVPVGYVKQAGAASLVDGDDTVRVERTVLGRLASRGFTSSPIEGGRPGTVWTRAVRGSEIASAATDHPALLDAMAAALGERLAAWSRLPSSTAVKRAATPWPLLPTLLPSMEAAARNDDLEHVLEATVDPDVARALAIAKGQWRPAVRFVHGDISRHNIMVGRRRRGASTPVITFIDLESCGLGHPAWDVVSAVETLAEIDPRPGERAVRAFRAAFGDAGGDACPSPAWTCVRALVSAWQIGVTRAPDRTPRVADALARAVASAREAG